MYTEGGSSSVLSVSGSSGTDFDVTVIVPEDDFISVLVLDDVRDEAGNVNIRTPYNITLEIGKARALKTRVAGPGLRVYSS